MTVPHAGSLLPSLARHNNQIHCRDAATSASENKGAFKSSSIYEFISRFIAI